MVDVGSMGCQLSTETGPSPTIYEYTVKDHQGNNVELITYTGKVLLVVNVAAQCGLADFNYKGLAELYEKYKIVGLEILAFPTNQFSNGSPESSEATANTMCVKFKAQYPVFEKVEVNGPNTAPVFKFLKSGNGASCLGSSIKWNFTKFLVDKNGCVVARYSPMTSPISIEYAIKKQLGMVSWCARACGTAFCCLSYGALGSLRYLVVQMHVVIHGD